VCGVVGVEDADGSRPAEETNRCHAGTA
jgi:hypothetical protein